MGRVAGHDAQPRLAVGVDDVGGSEQEEATRSEAQCETESSPEIGHPLRLSSLPPNGPALSCAPPVYHHGNPAGGRRSWRPTGRPPAGSPGSPSGGGARQLQRLVRPLLETARATGLLACRAWRRSVTIGMTSAAMWAPMAPAMPIG